MSVEVLSTKVDQLRDDVRVIQAERRVEERQLVRRNGLIAVFVSLGVTIGFKVAELIWK